MAPENACMAKLSDLTSLSKTINEQSDEINHVIDDVERNLAALRLGVEAWLETDALAERLYRNTINQGTKQQKEEQFLTETYLGYGRHGDGFSLLIKNVNHVKSVNSWGPEEWEVESEEQPKVLRQASRDIRIKALARLEKLLDVIKKEAEEVLKSIAAGRKAAANLKESEGE